MMQHHNGNGLVRIFSARACAAPLEKAARLFEQQTGIVRDETYRLATRLVVFGVIGAFVGGFLFEQFGSTGTPSCA